MLSKLRESVRYSPESLLLNRPDDKGRLFLLENKSYDLSGVNLLHFGVDTVRQLFKGILPTSKAGALQGAIDSGLPTFQLLGQVFSISKLGKSSGYRYKLQNNELGLILLIGSYYTKLDFSGSHLKIEVSPHFIASMSAKKLTVTLDKYAAFFLTDYQASGVAVHLSVDFQGWQPQGDFVERFVTRTRSFRDYFGIDSGEFNASEFACSYGRGESFTFGKANALQTCLYRKDLQAQKVDKIDYWRSVWGDKYVSDSPVWRLEVRFHHTVLGDLGRGFDGAELATFEDVDFYLSEIWSYALTNNRSEVRKNRLSPIWQLLRDDSVTKRPVRACRRVKKTATGNVGRNIANALGNLVTLYAREKKTIKSLWAAVKKLHIWETIKSYYWLRGIDEGGIFNMLSDSLLSRRLIGNAA